MTDGQSRNLTLSDNLKKIFLHDYHLDNQAKMTSFSGYNMPINYDLGIIKENIHVRNSAGIFDVSHMGQILISFSEYNIELLSKFIPLDFNKIKVNKSYYSFILNEKGCIVDDIILSKIIINKDIFFYVVYNASRKVVNEKIFKDNLTNIQFLTNNSLLAIQGPKAELILKILEIENDLLFMESKVCNYLNQSIIVSRSGYTGEDGFEISIPNSIILSFIQLIMKIDSLKLCGLGSRDSLRLEAGLSLYGNELNENITPIEANLSWSIHKERLSDPRLNGQKILLSQFNNGTNKLKIGIQSKSKSILRSNMKLIDKNKNEIGVITSGGFSPNLKTSIGIGYINTKSKSDIDIYCLIRDKVEELMIVKLPFIRHNYRRGK